jgi:hypothetical protein
MILLKQPRQLARFPASLPSGLAWRVLNCQCLQKRLITRLKAGARCDPHVIKEVWNLDRPEIDSQPRITAQLGLPPEPCGRIAVSGCSAFVMMVQTTDFASLGHLAFGARLYSPGVRGILGER